MTGDPTTSDAQRSRRLRLVVGLAIHGVALGALVAFCVAAAEPAADIAARLVSAVDGERDDDLVLDVETTEGLFSGLPAYVLDADGGGRVVGHVLDYDEDARRIRVRFAPGEGGVYTARVFPPRGLRDALQLAVPQDVAAEMLDELRVRTRRLWDEVLEPDVKERMPAFLDRLDPRGENPTRETMQALGDEVIERMQPHMDGLVAEVTGAVDDQLDLWDRLGVLWDMVRGDEKRLQRKLAPVAKKAARGWWDDHRGDVMSSIGEAFEARLPELRRWVEQEAFVAAREELVEPLLETHADRFETEGEAVLRMVLDRVVQLPDNGGFQVRFAAMLRNVLLRKRTALLILVPPDAGGSE